MYLNKATVAIIGRENVGKSSLFNRLTEENSAMVSAVAGTTRDRKYGEVLWRGQNFWLIDTAGYDLVPDNTIKKGALEQIKLAIEEADLLLFVVDSQVGLTPEDRELANLAKKNKKPLILVANKADNQSLRLEVNQFLKLGLGKAWPVSANNGSGTGDLLDKLTDEIQKLKLKTSTDEKTSQYLKLAFLGQPNVGKSSIINGILKEKRLVVSEQAHTTREPNSIFFSYKKQNFELIDTAGINRAKNRQVELGEKSFEKSIEAIRKAHIAVLVLDASQPINKQDLHLAGVANDNYKGLILVMNKWDKVPNKDAKIIYQYHREVAELFAFMKWVPIIFTSATKDIRLKEILDTALKIQQERNKRIPNDELKLFLKDCLRKNPPPQLKNPHIKELEQTHTNPPTFTIVAKTKKWIHFSYLRYLENQLRKRYGFKGTPIKFIKKQIK